MFSTLSGKKAIADDSENRTRCTIYQNRNGWQGFERIRSCNCLFKITGERKTAICGIKKKEIRRHHFKKLSIEWFGLCCPKRALRHLITSVLFIKLICSTLHGSQPFTKKSVYISNTMFYCVLLQRLI